MKKRLSSILALLLAFSVVQVYATGYETEYTFDKKTGTLTITMLCNEDKNVSNSSGDGEKYAESYDWYEYKNKTKKVVIAGSLKIVPFAAFAEFENLEEVVIQDKVKTIGDFAFHKCPKLKSIKLPASLEKVGFEALYRLDSLKEITIPKGTTDFTISHCKAVERFIVEEGNSKYKVVDDVLYSLDGETLIAYPAAKEGDYNVLPGTKTIAPFAFSSSQKLVSVTIPNTVEVIEDGAFYGSEKLEKVNFEQDSKLKRVRDWYDYMDGSEERFGAFGNCPSLKELSFPDSLLTVEGDIVYGSKNFKTISFGETFRRIVDNSAGEEYDGISFVVSDSLKNINISEKNLMYASVDGVVYSKDLTTLILYPSGRDEKTYTVHPNTREIASFAFSTMSSTIYIKNRIEKIVLSPKTTKLQAGAFYGCRKLKTIKNIGNVKEIGEYTFADCQNLTSIKLEKIKVLPYGTFSGCSKLKYVTLGKGLKKINKEVFYEANALRRVTIKSKKAKILKEAFVFSINKKKNKINYVMRNPKKFVLKGPKNSTVQKYAKKYNLKFRSI